MNFSWSLGRTFQSYFQQRILYPSIQCSTWFYLHGQSGVGFSLMFGEHHWIQIRLNTQPKFNGPILMNKRWTDIHIASYYLISLHVQVGIVTADFTVPYRFLSFRLAAKIHLLLAGYHWTEILLSWTPPHEYFRSFYAYHKLCVQCCQAFLHQKR